MLKFRNFFKLLVFCLATVMLSFPLEAQEQLLKKFGFSQSSDAVDDSDRLTTLKDVRGSRERVEVELKLARETANLELEVDQLRVVGLQEILNALQRQKSAMSLVDRFQAEFKAGQANGWRQSQMTAEDKLVPPLLQYLKYQELALVAKEREKEAELSGDDARRLLRDFKRRLAKLEQTRRQRKEVSDSDPENLSAREQLELATLRSRLARQQKMFQRIRLESVRYQKKIHAARSAVYRELASNIKKTVTFSEKAKKDLFRVLEKRKKELLQEENRVRAEVSKAERELDLAQVGESRSDIEIEVLSEIQQGKSAVLESVLDRQYLLEQIESIWERRFSLARKELTSEQHNLLKKQVVDFGSRVKNESKVLRSRLTTLVNQAIELEARRDGALLSGETKLFQQLQRAFQEQARGVGKQIAVRERIEVLLLDAGEELGLKSGKDRWWGAELYNDWLVTVWRHELIVLDDNPITFGKIVQAFILFFLGIFLSRRLTNRVAKKLLPRLGLGSGMVAAVESIAYYILILSFGLISLKIVHIPLTIFTLAGGALAIGIGFGSQNIVNNFFSGLILLIEQPIRVGDIVEFSGIRGTVRRIGGRSTLMVTPQNHELVVPNSALVENNVINWTLANNLIRRSINVGVAYGSPTRDVSKILSTVASDHGQVLDTPSAEVLFRNFGDSSLEFELRFWIKMISYAESLKIESDLRHMIDHRFKQAGLVIAFPQRDVHLDLPEGVLRVALERSKAGNEE